MSRPILSPLPGGDPAIYERARKASERASGLRDARDRAIDAIRRRLARLTRREIPPSILLVEDDEAIDRKSVV